MDHTNGAKQNTVNDALGLPTAQAFEQDLTKRLANDEALTLVALDVDDFAHVNDTFGWDVGDDVLIEAGRYLHANLPNDAALYRYGGDAFHIIFPSTYEKENVFLVMEKLRDAHAYRLPDDTRATFSIGVAASPEDAAQYGELLRKAEGAMIRAKLLGKDRVCLAREEKMVIKTSHYTQDQLTRLTKLAKREGTGEAILLREALDGLFKKYDV